MFRRERKVIVEVTAAELRLIRASLLALRNRLISEGRYTDPVDEMLMKVTKKNKAYIKEKRWLIY